MKLRVLSAESRINVCPINMPASRYIHPFFQKMSCRDEFPTIDGTHV
jgi:hypothetical protein